jgi:hypothetical protein
MGKEENTTHRAVPRMERRDKTDDFENAKVAAGIGAGIAAQPSLQNQNQTTPKLHVSASGATSSHVPLRYDLIPRSLLEVAALRYTEGARIHGERGYQRGLTDRAFILNRINHIAEHWNKLFHRNEIQDQVESAVDHLGAIIWGIGFLCEVAENVSGSLVLADILEQGRVKTYSVDVAEKRS